MAQRTYLIGLYIAEKALYRYITRWQQKLEANTEPEVMTCILAVLTALEECLPLITPAAPTE